MHLPNITTGNIEQTIFVNTKHGNRLEFVLDDAADRLGKDFYDALMMMLGENGLDCIEYGAYGDVWVVIRVGHPYDIEPMQIRANKVVSAWKARYNIDKMKDNQ